MDARDADRAAVRARDRSGTAGGGRARPRTRATQRRHDIERTEVRRAELRQSFGTPSGCSTRTSGPSRRCARRCATVDEQVITLRAEFGAADHADPLGRVTRWKACATEVMQSEVARAGAASDLGHLAALCLEAVGLPLDQVSTRSRAWKTPASCAAPARRLAAVSVPDEDEEPEGAGGATPRQTTAGAAAEAGAADAGRRHRRR